MRIYIREIGLFTDDGKLVAIGRRGEELAVGEEDDFVYRFEVFFDQLEALVVTVDPIHGISGSRRVDADTGLDGGGDLSVNRTIKTNWSNLVSSGTNIIRDHIFNLRQGSSQRSVTAGKFADWLIDELSRSTRSSNRFVKASDLPADTTLTPATPTQVEAGTANKVPDAKQLKDYYIPRETSRNGAKSIMYPIGGRGEHFQNRAGYLEIKMPEIDSALINNYVSFDVEISDQAEGATKFSIFYLMRDNSFIAYPTRLPKVTVRGEPKKDYTVRFVAENGFANKIYIGDDDTYWGTVNATLSNLIIGGNGKAATEWADPVFIDGGVPITGTVEFTRNIPAKVSSFCPGKFLIPEGHEFIDAGLVFLGSPARPNFSTITKFPDVSLLQNGDTVTDATPPALAGGHNLIYYAFDLGEEYVIQEVEIYPAEPWIVTYYNGTFYGNVFFGSNDGVTWTQLPLSLTHNIQNQVNGSLDPIIYHLPESECHSYRYICFYKNVQSSAHEVVTNLAEVIIK